MFKKVTVFFSLITQVIPYTDVCHPGPLNLDVCLPGPFKIWLEEIFGSEQLKEKEEITELN